VLELGNEAFLQYEGERNELYRNIVGGQLIQYYGFKTDGIWLSQDQINASGLTSTFRDAFNPGQLRIVDVNKDGIINNNDRTILGSPYPDFTWGMTNTFTYKNFDFAFTFQGSQGGKLINGDPNYDEVKNEKSVYFKFDKDVNINEYSSLNKFSKLKTSNLEDYLDLNYTGNNNPFKKGIDNFYSKSEARYSNNYHAILNAKTKELWIVISFKD
jgi:hypothetical protein